MNRCLVDTNVPITANLYGRPDPNSDTPDCCIRKCYRKIKNIITEKDVRLVLDDTGEILQEYMRNLSLRGQPGVGDGFVKWVNDHQWNLTKIDRVPITKSGDSYAEFPTHDGLNNFDPADRKFVAAANAHPEKPPIVQATDSKWWGWNDALAEVGIEVCFLCRKYIETKYNKKMVK